MIVTAIIGPTWSIAVVMTLRASSRKLSTLDGLRTLGVSELTDAGTVSGTGFASRVSSVPSFFPAPTSCITPQRFDILIF